MNVVVNRLQWIFTQTMNVVSCLSLIMDIHPDNDCAGCLSFTMDIHPDKECGC